MTVQHWLCILYRSWMYICFVNCVYYFNTLMSSASKILRIPLPINRFQKLLCTTSIESTKLCSFWISTRNAIFYFISEKNIELLEWSLDQLFNITCVTCIWFKVKFKVIQPTSTRKYQRLQKSNSSLDLKPKNGRTWSLTIVKLLTEGQCPANLCENTCLFILNEGCWRTYFKKSTAMA